MNNRESLYEIFQYENQNNINIQNNCNIIYNCLQKQTFELKNIPYIKCLTTIAEITKICTFSNLYKILFTLTVKDILTYNDNFKTIILSIKSNNEIPFSIYFINILYSFGCPVNSIIDTLNEKEFVLTLDAISWLEKHIISNLNYTINKNPYIIVDNLPSDNSYIIRLGKYSILSAFLVCEHYTLKPMITLNNSTIFVDKFISKVQNGGKWVLNSELQLLCCKNQKLSTKNNITPEDFYKKLYNIIWNNNKFIFNNIDLDNEKNELIDDRHYYEKLTDLIWKPSKTNIILPYNDTKKCYEMYHSYSLLTCCVYNISDNTLEKACLLHIKWALLN